MISSEEDEVIQPTRTRRSRFVDDDGGIQIGRTLVRERVLREISRIRRSTRIIESDSETEVSHSLNLMLYFFGLQLS